jgi:hypothetical protein
MLDYCLNARSKAASYRALLSALQDAGFESRTLLEGASLPADADVRVLYVRHDVDHDLEAALGMARIENEMGIRASYYLLPPGDYNKDENYYGRLEGGCVVHSARLQEVVREIHRLGHEIGLHNDFLQLSDKLGRDVPSLIRDEVAYFATLGIPVRGSASHGSRYVRAHGMTNYEIFSECKKSTSIERSVILSGDRSFELYSLSFRSLGLDYEAYYVRRDGYVADTGSRFTVNRNHHETVNANLVADEVSTLRRVVLLIHPEWWKPVDQAAKPQRPLSTVMAPSASAAGSLAQAVPAAVPVTVQQELPPLSFARSDGKPFRVAIRGDCCSRRAVALNRDCFPHGVELFINEKSPAVCFNDTVRGLTPTMEQISSLCRIDEMPPTLKHYYVGQIERSILDADDLDLLIVDSYADMNFELWQHAQGWKVWVHPKYLNHDSPIAAAMKKLGYVSLSEAAASICSLIDYLRLRQPRLPVLFLNQPVEFYPKLDKRKEFYELGRMVAELRPEVYFGGVLPEEALELADVGSCGPGLTLHFTGPTYRRMMESAWQKGLWRAFSGEQGDLPVSSHDTGATAVAAAPVEEMGFVRKDGKPLRIAMRGDFTARRAVVLNKELFPRGVELIASEKSPIASFADTVNGKTPSLEQAMELCDTEAMHPTLKHYYLGQLDRSVLSATDLDLLIIDSYADMHYELWQHEGEGWRLWIHPKYYRPDNSLAARMRKQGPVTLEEATRSACVVIDSVREKNPGLPVLFLNQPVEFVPRLQKHKHLYELGRCVANLRPQVYVGVAEASEDDLAEPGPAGGAAPLYFKPSTYRTMLRQAWTQGLEQHFAAVQPAPLPVLPEVSLSFLSGTKECVPQCEQAVQGAFKSFREYFCLPDLPDATLRKRFTPMLIDTQDLLDFAAWEKFIKGFSGGERMRQKKKALAAGYVFKPFAWKLFIPDIHEINHSKETRSGGAMRESYQKSIEEMGGAPEHRHELSWPMCPYHWGMTFGVFLPQPGHTQGSVIVNEKLVAYISLRRTGEVAVYSMILGHAEHLNNGTLVLLHHELAQWIAAHQDGVTKELRYVMYGGQQSGGKGLSEWKRRAGFKPYLVSATLQRHKPERTHDGIASLGAAVPVIA